MPGIVGIITKKDRKWAESQLSKMVDSIYHYPFYEKGILCEEKVGLYVGWTAIKGSFSSGMPVQNEDGSIYLVFGGEDYSDPDLIKSLRNKGHNLGSQESSYIVHLYEEHVKFYKQLNGMFHGIVADLEKNSLTLFNDRYGMQKLYYHESRDCFYFAVEAKAIIAARPDLRNPNLQSLGEFISCSCVLEDRTLFKDINALPSASAWTFQNGSVHKKIKYFSPSEWENQESLNSELFYQKLKSTLSKNLPRYFKGPEKMGIAMTGGLDTRVILACHTPAPGLLPSYTFGGKYRESRDVKIGRKIAKICKQPHQVIEVGNDFLTRFGEYAEKSIYITEGGVDVYRASDLYVSEKVREIAPVKIVGTYGSEIVCQAVMFKPTAPRAGLFQADFLKQINKAEETYALLRKQDPATFAAFIQSPWYHYGILALEKSQLTVRSPFLDNDFVKTIYEKPEDNSKSEDVRLRLIREGSAALAKIPSDRGIGGERNFLVSALSNKFQEFTFKAEYAYDYGMPQWIARIDNMFSALHFEKLFLGRHKLLHFRVWYKNELSKYVAQILLDPLTLSRPYINKSKLQFIVNGHLKGNRNYTLEIHKMLTFELLQRLFFD